MRRSFYVAGLLLGGLTVGAAVAAPGVTTAAGALGMGAWTSPVAMCGNSCRSGGRYFPGPPSVCADEGLNYCGSSRDAGPPRRFYEERRGPYYDERRGYERRQERYERY